MRKVQLNKIRRRLNKIVNLSNNDYIESLKDLKEGQQLQFKINDRIITIVKEGSKYEWYNHEGEKAPGYGYTIDEIVSSLRIYSAELIKD